MAGRSINVFPPPHTHPYLPSDALGKLCNVFEVGKDESKVWSFTFSLDQKQGAAFLGSRHLGHLHAQYWGAWGSVGTHTSLQVLDLAQCSIPSKSNGKGCSTMRQGNQCGKHLRCHMVFNATSIHCIGVNVMEGSSAAEQMGNTITVKT